MGSGKEKAGANGSLARFWGESAADLLQRLGTTSEELSGREASRRLAARVAAGLLKRRRGASRVSLFFRQFGSPIIIILIFAAILSAFLRDVADAGIILGIVFVSGMLGFWQERGAADAVRKLLAIVQIKAAVVRDGSEVEVPVEQVVPGDVAILNAGDMVPGDCLILESRDLFVDEAALTGETYPVEKQAGTLPPETPLAQRTNSLFMGTHVVSGTAKAAVVHAGAETEFGKVSERLRLRPPETEFEHGVRRFGYLLMEVTLMLVICVFAINVYFRRPVLDSFLFSMALAVGLTPQLLPAIISINLAHGARRMAQAKVIVKRLASIENFGSMNVLCSDKTGTLTEGVATLHSAIDGEGGESEKVLLYAYLNAYYETGFANPIDEAIRRHCQLDVSGYAKVDEVPYDFVRKRLSILVAKGAEHLLVTKGAVEGVLEVCTSAETAGEGIVPLAAAEERIRQQYTDLSGKGFRTLGIAYRGAMPSDVISKDDEKDMTFLGFVVLSDPPKAGIGETIADLKRLGVFLKMITGDNRLVALNVSQQVGLSESEILTGPEIRQMSDEALRHRVNEVDVFAEVEPNQKERIMLALKKTGNVVGYLGDGINDAPALHAADVGISVDTAVDVAKEAADFVLLEKDLRVLVGGVREGRLTFANTLKYIFMATSANFGNMFSMAGASLFLPFLPLLPKQILLTNLLTDLPEMAIASDNVDREALNEPRRWDVRFIRNFMLAFGPLSSVFDYATFGVLLLVLHASPGQFRTGWFMESVVSASLIVLVIRSRRPFFKSMPGKYLLMATLVVAVVTVVLPYLRIAGALGFQPLPGWFVAVVFGIILPYVAGAEIMKRAFYKRAMGQGQERRRSQGAGRR